MNVALLCKWWWRLDSESGIWQDIITSKYLKKDVVAKEKHKLGDTPIWADLLKVKALYLKGRENVVKNGRGTLIWTDRWRESPLCLQFPVLFELCMEKTVGEFIDRNGDVRFRRWLHEILYDQWQCVKREVLSIFVTTENDVTRWREGGWKIQIKMEKAQIIPLKYSESLDNPLKYFLVHFTPKLRHSVQFTP
jgi:hypothetical protein